jgi:hypothetical protein
MAVTKVQDSALLVVDADYRVSWYTWCQNQWGINDVAYAIDATVGAPTMGDLAEAFQTLTEANQGVWLPTQASILGTRVTKLTGPAPRPIAGVATSTAIGTLTGPPVPTQSTGIISCQTALAGRGYRGRIFLPFVAPAFIGTDGLPTAAYKSIVGTYGDYLYGSPTTLIPAAGGSITLHPVLWHKATAGSTPIIGRQVRSYWGTMRKRGDLGRTNPKSIPL